MLSNPTNNLHNRQRQHRRQQSTPHAYEPVKATNLPNIQRHGLHRRGMSLDLRRRQSPPQDLNVSITNQGYQTTPQHILRETQQQRLARPGRHFRNYDNDENYSNSPIVTPQRQSFDAGCANQYDNRGLPNRYSYSGPIETILDVEPSSFGGTNDFNLFPSDGSFTPTEFLDFSASFDNNQGTHSESHSRRTSVGRRISGGIVDRVAQFENLAIQSPLTQRPITPPNQNVSSYFPPTPVETPHGLGMKHEPINQRFLDSYDTSMEETIKPKPHQRARGVFDDMRREAESHAAPSRSHVGRETLRTAFDSAPMPTANFMNMSNIAMQFMKTEEEFDLQYSPSLSNNSQGKSYNSSPNLSQSAVFTDPFASRPSMTSSMSYPDPTTSSSAPPSSPGQNSDYRRSESVSSVNPDEAITETGITIDDIATFIQGPDPLDAKWVCLFPDCNKRFGRKENIKSHVQTHLGDRQFQCPHCKKCFVRQHDLKRHAKIHSGVKPYPCQCGNSFARHDALTRHRQRGMCIGAFEGVVKKVVKRGRPRKNRPEDEERLNKSSRTRSKNKDKTMSSASSTTGCSESNGGSSPRSDYDILDDKPFGEYDYTKSSATTDRGSFEYSQSYSPRPNDYVSPQATQTAHSPSAFSNHSQSQSSSTHRGSNSDSSATHLPSQSSPASPAKSSQSYHSHSPPGLCESSSSPAASSQNYYDLDTSSSSQQDLNMSLNLGNLSNISDLDDEMFLEAFEAATNSDVNMSQLERDPNLLMGKFEFEDAFGGEEGGVVMEGNDDVFFGSP